MERLLNDSVRSWVKSWVERQEGLHECVHRSFKRDVENQCCCCKDCGKLLYSWAPDYGPGCND